MAMRIKACALLAVVALAAGAVPARAATATCGGISPLATTCTVKIKMTGKRLKLTFKAGVVFAGLLEATARSGSRSAYLGPCTVATAATTACVATRSGTFRAGNVVTVVARIVPDPGLGLPLGVGEWSLTATG